MYKYLFSLNYTQNSNNSITYIFICYLLESLQAIIRCTTTYTDVIEKKSCPLHGNPTVPHTVNVILSLH